MIPSQEDIDNQLYVLVTRRRSLALHLRQRAISGSGFMASNLMHAIIEGRQDIARIKAILRSWGIDVEDHPDDEEASINNQHVGASNLAQSPPQVSQQKTQIKVKLGSKTIF